MIRNKRGQTLTELISFSVFVFIFLIILGVTLYWFSQLNVAFTDSNIVYGDINYSNYSAETIGVVNTAFQSNTDLIAIMFIFGYVLFIMVSGYLARDFTPKLFLIMDFLILLVGYIISTYMANAYETLLPDLPFLALINSNINTGSTIMLNLPTIVVVVGILTMIITYAGIPKSKEEQVGGF